MASPDSKNKVKRNTFSASDVTHALCLMCVIQKRQIYLDMSGDVNINKYCFGRDCMYEKVVFILNEYRELFKGVKKVLSSPW